MGKGMLGNKRNHEVCFVKVKQVDLEIQIQFNPSQVSQTRHKS